MRRASLALLAALLVAAANPLAAEGPSGREAEGPGSRASEFWDLIQQLRGDQRNDSLEARGARPRALPEAAAGGPTLDLTDLGSPVTLERQLDDLARQPDSLLRVSVPGGAARAGAFSIGSDQVHAGHLLVMFGNAEIFGRVQGNLVTYEGDVIVHPGAVVAGDILAVHGDVINRGGEVQGEALTLVAAPDARAGPPPSALTVLFRRLAGVAGVFLALAVIAWGLAAFGQQSLQTVSDTASHSFGRSFVTGLVGQILILPTFGMLVVGLVLSVAGILLLPFAVVVFALLVIVGVVGGVVAVAHAMGETYTRRRMAAGLALGAPGHLRFALVGMAPVMVLWLAWALVGWAPVAGTLVWSAAVLVTWLVATVGFGASLLSRAGVREGFAGRIIPPEALTDEYLWATPRYGVPAVQRPGASAPPGRR